MKLILISPKDLTLLDLKLNAQRFMVKILLSQKNPYSINLCIIDDSAKGGLTQFWELITMIPCATKDFKS